MRRATQKSIARITRKNQRTRKRASKATKAPSISLLRKKVTRPELVKDAIGDYTRNMHPNQALPKYV